MKPIFVFFTMVIFTISAQESIKLSTSEFDKKVMDQTNQKIINNQIWFIQFFAPWCDHCKTLAPIWDNLIIPFKNEVNFGRIDCTAKESKEIC